jgi:hypothetical protein
MSSATAVPWLGPLCCTTDVLNQVDRYLEERPVTHAACWTVPSVPPHPYNAEALLLLTVTAPPT